MCLYPCESSLPVRVGFCLFVVKLTGRDPKLFRLKPLVSNLVHADAVHEAIFVEVIGA